MKIKILLISASSILLSILLFSQIHSTIYGAVTTGYHLEYHNDHKWTYLGSATDSSGTFRETYVFKCDGVIYKYYQWSWYATASPAWGESSISTADGKVTKAIAEPSFDNFKSTFLPNKLDCPGYEVANNYTVKYNGNNSTSGSTEESSHTYDQEKKLSANQFYRTGYSFTGWNTKADGSGKDYDNKESVKNLTARNNGTVTLYAQWNANSYQVTFDANGGISTTTSKTVTYDKTYGSLPEPSQDGFSFEGWYTTLEGGTKITAEDIVTITSNQTLFARWRAIPYQLTFDANGGSSSLQKQTYFYSDEVDLNPVASKTGYTFIGWATSPSDSIALSSYQMPASHVTLYALYSTDVSDISKHPDHIQLQNTNSDLYLVIKQGEQTTLQQPLTYTSNYTTAKKTYRYLLNTTNLSSRLGSNPFSWSIVAFDNAGNYSYIGSKPPSISESFDQTVQHWTLNEAGDKVDNFSTTQESIQKGLTYTPKRLTDEFIPAGYQFSSIDSAYSVTSNKISFAYYKPKIYTLTFQPQGGTVSPTSKSVTYQELYGHLPIPSKPGYSFEGWFTHATGGEEKSSSDTYEIAANSSLYAHWNANNYNVFYDYRTNGGSSSTKTGASFPYGTSIDLSPTATKEGWTFVGWNTNPDATTAISALSMPADDITLYAIYKKELTATFIDGDRHQQQQISGTIFNRQTTLRIDLPSVTSIAGWNVLGWSFSTEGNASVHASADTSYLLQADQTFYACYTQDITLSYDTNGSAQAISTQTKKRFFNASGNYENPIFTTAMEPGLMQHSFVRWEELSDSGSILSFFPAGIDVTLDHSMTLTAKWDAYPQIEAYDRYFTLEDAKNGAITYHRLLEKVTAADKEDGLLINDSCLHITNYVANIFTSLTSNEAFPITYRVTDSFGNMLEKTITVHIVDTTVIQSSSNFYTRFIRSDFYHDETNFISNDNGGLESTSIWRSNAAYQRLLEHALTNDTPIQSFTFSVEDISQLKGSP